MQKLGYIISGTCGGFQNDFIRCSSWIQRDKITLVDIRNNDDKNTKGKQCYALSLQGEFNIISKIEIIKDGFRSKSTGFISFNLIIPSGLYIDEDSIFSILDEGLGFYTDEFVQDNVLEDEKNSSEFDTKIEHLLSSINPTTKATYKWKKGTQDAAYIYIPKDKISEYFKYENIFQEDYKDYREIYFIDPSEKDNPSSILNALKHEPNADITTKINLDNPDYTIALEIEEGITFHGIQEGTKIKLNDKAGFGFSKKHYKTNKPNYSGSWKELLDKYSEVVYLSKEYPNTIVIKSPKFQPEIKKITIKFNNDDNGKLIGNNEVSYSIISNEKSKRIDDNLITFIGDEISLIWEIKVNKNEKYKASSTYQIRPEFEKSISIRVEPVSPPFDWRPILNGLVIFLLVGGIGFLGYWGFSSMFNTKAGNKETKKTTVTKESNSEIEKIEFYLSGNELIADTLKSFVNKLGTSDSLLLYKTKNYLKFRNAIDGNDRNKIQFTYDSLRLDRDHNGLLIKILDSIDFKDYKAIENRKSMFLSDLIVKVDSIIEIKRSPKVSNNSNKNVSNVNSAGNQNDSKVIKEDKPKPTAKYTDKEFIQAFSKNNVNDTTKLTDHQQEVHRDYKQLDDQQKKDLEHLGDPKDLNDMSRKIKEILNDE